MAGLSGHFFGDYMADNIVVRDGNASAVTMKTTESGGVHTPHQIVSGYDQQDDMLKVKSVQKKFRDSFIGTGLNAEKWESSIGTGGAITISAGTLILGSGNTANATTFAMTKEFFSVPFRVSIGMSLSQRIANQSFVVEAVSVDPSTGIPDGSHSAAWVFDGTVATQAKYQVQNGGLTPLTSAGSAVPTSASLAVFEVEPFADECWFHAGVIDSTAGRANSYRRHQQIPDPNAFYKIRLRWLNGAVAPASNTNATIQYLAVQDYAELTAEITAGRGQTVAGQGIGVNVIQMPKVAVINTPNSRIYYNDSVANQASGATLTGTSRDTGTAAGTIQKYSNFSVFVLSDQSGTIRIECSNENTTWRRMTLDTAVSANTPVTLSVPVMTRYHRVVYVNGSTATTIFMLNSAYSA